MPVIIKNGDLLTAPVDIIIHSCNCFHTMGGGLAKRVRATFPEAYQADLRTIRGDKNKLGSYSYAIQKGKMIVNLYGQFMFGRDKRYTDYQAVRKGLTSICTQYSNKKIGLPQNMGCSLGGGDWSIVYDIILEVAEQTGATIEIWSYNP